jgi:hypothetical protein
MPKGFDVECSVEDVECSTMKMAISRSLTIIRKFAATEPSVQLQAKTAHSPLTPSFGQFAIIRFFREPVPT